MSEAIQPKKMTFSMAITTPTYKDMINRALGDPEHVKRFIASITSAVAINPLLQECESSTILSAALLGESLNLSPSPQLGQYYLVPFNDTKRNCKVAQFQIGYKGYVQLALRSGQYADLDCLEIREGEYKGRNRQTGKHEFEFITDDDRRETLPVIGYLAYFEYLNGFKKAIYWTKQKVESHALKYSKGYAAKKGYTFWEKDFDGMAFKTLLRQLISKWGIMSIEMQQAFEADADSNEGFDLTDSAPKHEHADAPIEGTYTENGSSEKPLTENEQVDFDKV